MFENNFVTLEIVDAKNFTAQIYHLKESSPIFRDVFVFLNPQLEKWSNWGGYHLVSLRNQYPISQLLSIEVI